MKSQKPVIAVTGGAQGIGKGILTYFCMRGYIGVVLDADLPLAQETAEELRRHSPESAAFACDVTDRSQVDRTYAQISERYERLDVQVNNAGIFRRERIMDSTDEITDAQIAVNLKGLIHTSRAAIRLMVPQKSGCIINAHSIVGSFPDFGLGVYGATKAAVAHLTRVMAAECAPYNIRVNGYAPCMTATRMTQHIIDTRPDSKLSQIPMRRFGTPEQIAKICWFFASDLSEYTTGVSLPCDGGAWAVQRPEAAWQEAGML